MARSFLSLARLSRQQFPDPEYSLSLSLSLSLSPFSVTEQESSLHGKGFLWIERMAKNYLKVFLQLMVSFLLHYRLQTQIKAGVQLRRATKCPANYANFGLLSSGR